MIGAISGSAGCQADYYASSTLRTNRGGEHPAGCDCDQCAAKTPGDQPLKSPGAKKDVDQLKKADQAVRRHEAAHMAAAGQYAMGGPSFKFEQGPDGSSYAVGGEVNIDTSPGRTPEETIQKAQQIRAAALAPADPSGQDLSVAAQAGQMEAQARQQLAERRAQAASEATGHHAGSSAQQQALARYQEGSFQFKPPTLGTITDRTA